MSLIEIRNLRKEYPDVVPLRDVSVNIEEGEVISIIGPSGTGKSTLLRCLNRLETPTSGSILIDGVDVCAPGADLPKIRQNMGMVFQSFNLFPHKMVVENIMMPQQSLLGRSAAEAYQEAMEQLRKVGLADKARSYPEELSGGQKQRVAIARALAMHPKILLFDEPTSALDPAMVSEVLSVIRDLAGTGLTMLIVTHEMRLARHVSDRVFFMSGGEICEQGPPEQIFDKPLKERTREFIFRIRSWEHTLSFEEQDLHGMAGSLEKFCKDRFMGRKDSMACQLVVEELVVNVLLPAVVRLKKGKIRLSLHAGEEGAERTLTVDYTEFPEAEELLAFLQVPADAAEGKARTDTAEGKARTDSREENAGTDAAEGQAFTDAAEEKASGSGQDWDQEPYRAILAHKLRRLPEGEPGTAVFRIL